MKYKLKRRKRVDNSYPGKDKTTINITLKARRKGFNEIHRILWYKQMLEQGSWLNVNE